MQINKIITHEENCTGCLTCQLICSFIHKKIFNPADSYIIIEIKNYNKKIIFTDECNNCGVCAKYCLYGALEGGSE